MANDNVSAVLGMKGSSGGSVTVDSALSLSSTNPVQNKVITHEINEITNTLSAYGTEISGKEDSPTTVPVSGTTPTITPAANTIYKCGELTSLTITDPPAAGAYSIVFTSGSTATTTTIPATILGLEDFAPEANTLYEINVLDNRAVVGSWAVSV